MSPRRFGLVLSAIACLAAALRLAWLGRDGLWTDEATTAILAARPTAELIAALRADVQAPLHYVLMRPFLALGDAEILVRLPSALAGVLTVVLCGIAGRARLGPVGGLAAAMFLAISPLHVAYSREARAYALLGLLTLLAFWAVDALRREPSRARVVLAGLAVGALPLTHGLGALDAVGVALAAGLPAPGEIAAWRRRALPSLMAAGILAVALATPWLLVTAGQGGSVAVAYSWAKRAWDAAFPWQVPLSFAALAPGAQPPVRSLWPGPSGWDLAAAGAALALVLLGVSRRRHLPRPDAPVRSLAAVLLTLGGIFALSWAVAPLHVVGRVEAPLAPVFALCVAAGLAVLPGRAAALVMLLALAASIPGLRAAIVDEWRSEERHLARMVASGADARDVVVVLGAFRFPLEYQLPRERPGILVTSFPDERNRHPSWIDWSLHDPASLAAEAGETAAHVEALLRARGGDDVLLVIVPEPGTAALRAALGARLALAGTWRTPVPGLEVEQYRLTALSLP